MNLKRLVEVEVLKDEIELNKQTIQVLKSKIQENQKTVNYLDYNDDIPKVWLNVGSLFMKLPNPKVQNLLQADSTDSEKTIKRLEKELTEKVRELRSKQGKSIAQD